MCSTYVFTLGRRINCLHRVWNFNPLLTERGFHLEKDTVFRMQQVILRYVHPEVDI